MKEWTINFKLKAEKALLSFHPDIRKRILGKLYFWFRQENPFFFAVPTPYLDDATHRFRVGDYRILVIKREKECLVVVVDIDDRKQVYRK